MRQVSARSRHHKCDSDEHLLDDRYRICDLQINKQVQTIVYLEELGGLLGSDRLLKFGIVLGAQFSIG
jgi:hypothetical protein